MKLQAEIGDDKHQIEIKRDGEKVFARVDDRRYEIEVSEPEPDVLIIKNQGRIYEASVAKTSAGDSMRITIKGRELEVRIIDPKRLRGSETDSEHGDGHAEIKTAMPGKVVRIVAAKGSSVAKGDTVLVVEAMKMQNELRSPKDGIVSEIRAEEGATVGAGDILAVVE